MFRGGCRWLKVVLSGSRWLQVIPSFFSNYAPSKLNIKPVQRLFKIAGYAFMLSLILHN